MKGYSTRLEEATRKNSYFRRVLYTGKHSQLIPMSLGPGEEIGEETHRTVDQFLRETGEGTVVIDGKSHRVKDGEGGCPGRRQAQSHQHFEEFKAKAVDNLLSARTPG
jgi:mannose-6-phosphate isomerase-like protein (cupin superfamily)